MVGERGESLEKRNGRRSGRGVDDGGPIESEEEMEKTRSEHNLSSKKKQA